MQQDADGLTTTGDTTLDGQRYTVHNGGPRFPPTPAISPYVECDTQPETDTLRAALTHGGAAGPGGSLVDRFGVTWQILPVILREPAQRGSLGRRTCPDRSARHDQDRHPSPDRRPRPGTTPHGEREPRRPIPPRSGPQTPRSHRQRADACVPRGPLRCSRR
ncbi:VOC family protein [Streptomyces parvulus]|uniref:VOC family protein n=1 Tax=Streptomyces parvulus TaxID=146923 RepID=UPI00370079AA